MRAGICAAWPRRSAQLARAVLVALSSILLAQCSVAAGGRADSQTISDVELTWLNARIVLPRNGRLFHYRMDDPRVAGWKSVQWQGPVVLYLHGCTGLGNADEEVMDLVASQGALVIAPDSFARRGRPLQCNQKEQTGGQNLFVYAFRQAEISFALQKIVYAPWIRSGPKILFGVSEGGVAAALYRGMAFSGRVIAQWTCHGDPLVAGISAPADEALLSIVQSEDPWYETDKSKGQAGDCSTFFNGRPNARSLVLHDGEKHNVFTNSEARNAVAEFLSGFRN